MLRTPENPSYGRQVMQEHSSTFSRASELLPLNLRTKTEQFYAFVRTADQFVDTDTPDHEGLAMFREQTFQSITGIQSGNRVIDNFAQIVTNPDNPIELPVIEAFLDTTAHDPNREFYETYDDLKNDFMYGVAGTIGIMLSRIWGAPEEAHYFAEQQGYAFQLANIIRDVGEDYELGRQYIPQAEVRQSGLRLISPAVANTREFAKLIRSQIERQKDIAALAKLGVGYLPEEARPPVYIATKLYDKTMNRIYEDPAVVFNKKVRPTKFDIGSAVLSHKPDAFLKLLLNNF